MINLIELMQNMIDLTHYGTIHTHTHTHNTMGFMHNIVLFMMEKGTLKRL